MSPFTASPPTCLPPMKRPLSPPRSSRNLCHPRHSLPANCAEGSAPCPEQCRHPGVSRPRAGSCPTRSPALRQCLSGEISAPAPSGTHLEIPGAPGARDGAGRTLSYGRTFSVQRPTRVATLAVGYADGFPRQASGRGAEGSPWRTTLPGARPGDDGPDSGRYHRSLRRTG